MRAINLTPYIRCRGALRRLAMVCTYFPLVAIAAAASTFHAVNNKDLLAVSLVSLLVAVPFAVILNTWVMQAVQTQRSFHWVLVLSGIGIAHTLSLVVLVLTHVEREGGILHDAILVGAWCFSLVFVLLVVVCVMRALHCKSGVEILPGVDFNNIFRRIKESSTVPPKLFYQDLLSLLSFFLWPLAVMCWTIFVLQDPLSLRSLIGASSTIVSFSIGAVAWVVVAVLIFLGSDRLFKRLVPPPTELLKDVSIKPVVFVRAFDDDILGIKWGGFISRILGPRMVFEQLIPAVTRLIGPFVAIGHPREGERWVRVNLPGRARRDFAKGTDWQSLIDEWLLRSTMIVTVWRPGTTDRLTQGLSWELRQIRERQLVRRLAVLCVPSGEAGSKSAWDAFWNSVAMPDTVPPSSSVDPSGVLGICFEGNGAPMVVFSDLVALDSRCLDRSVYVLALGIMTLTIVGDPGALWKAHA